MFCGGIVYLNLDGKWVPALIYVCAQADYGDVY